MWHEDLMPWQEVKEHAVVVGMGTTVQLVPQNPARVAIMFGAPATGECYVSTRQGFVQPQGLPLSNANSTFPLLLSHMQYGAIVQQAWYGTSTVGATITVIEMLMDTKPTEYSDARQGKQSGAPMQVRIYPGARGIGRNDIDRSSPSQP